MMAMGQGHTAPQNMNSDGHEVTKLLQVYNMDDYPPLKTNISPEKWWLEDAFPIEIVPSYGTFLSFLGYSQWLM